MGRHGVSAALSARLWHEATEGLLELVESARTEWTEHVLTLAEVRFERRLTQEISALRVDFTRELHSGLSAVRQEIAAVRVELIRWSFVFWVGQIAVMIGVLSLRKCSRE